MSRIIYMPRPNNFFSFFANLIKLIGGIFLMHSISTTIQKEKKETYICIVKMIQSNTKYKKTEKIAENKNKKSEIQPEVRRSIQWIEKKKIKLPGRRWGSEQGGFQTKKPSATPIAPSGWVCTFLDSHFRNRLNNRNRWPARVPKMVDQHCDP